MSYNYLEQYETWQQERVGKFTASDIWKLTKKGRNKDVYFGEQAMTYIHQKAAELLTGFPVGFVREGIDSVEWGNAHEFEAIQELEKSLKINVEYYGKANPKFFPYGDYAGGSPDAVYGNEILIEVKCPYNSSEHLQHLLLADSDDLKSYNEKYFWQIQANLLFTNRTKGYFISYDCRFPKKEYQLKILPVEKDNGAIEALIERIAEAEKQLRVIVELLNECSPSVLLAEYDNETNATIIN